MDSNENLQCWDTNIAYSWWHSQLTGHSKKQKINDSTSSEMPTSGDLNFFLSNPLVINNTPLPPKNGPNRPNPPHLTNISFSFFQIYVCNWQIVQKCTWEIWWPIHTVDGQICSTSRRLLENLRDLAIMHLNQLVMLSDRTESLSSREAGSQEKLSCHKH